MYTERFSEGHRPIAKINPASYSSEQNTARFDMALYARVAIVYIIGAMASTAVLDSDIEQSDAASGGNTKNVSGKSITQLTQASGDSNKLVCVELSAEELDVDGGFHYVNVELTPATAASIVGVLVFGIEPRYKPIGVTEWDEVKD
jgi:hypothetical protein